MVPHHSHFLHFGPYPLDCLHTFLHSPVSFHLLGSFHIFHLALMALYFLKVLLGFDGPLTTIYIYISTRSRSAYIEFKQSSDKSRSSHKEFGCQLPNQFTLILFRSINLRLSM